MKKKTPLTLRAYSEELFQKLSANGQTRTARAYRGAVNQLTAFLKKEEIAFEEIDSAMMQKFQEYFLNRNRSMNTVSFYMRQLRSIRNKAIKAGRFKSQEDPFERVFTANASTLKRALDAQELSNIAHFEIELPPPTKGEKEQEMKIDEKKKIEQKTRMEQEMHIARLYLLFSFHGSGISFVDLCFLRKSSVRGGYIHYFRKKTGKELIIPINKRMREIINSFAGQVKDSPFVFPILNPAKGNLHRQYETALDRQNRLLKRLGKMMGLKQPLTTHVARHSWATIARKQGARISQISQGLGHSDEKTTRIYLASFDNQEMRKLCKKVSAAIE